MSGLPQEPMCRRPNVILGCGPKSGLPVLVVGGQLRQLRPQMSHGLLLQPGCWGYVMSAHEHWQMDASAPELYERYLVPAITSVWANDLLDRVCLRGDESVLDIACGTGVVARWAAQRGHVGHLVGIDRNACNSAGKVCDS